jgi:hypothetical protein
LQFQRRRLKYEKLTDDKWWQKLMLSLFLRPRGTSPLKGVNPAGTPGYRNGTESFFGLKGRPSVVRDVEIHNQICVLGVSISLFLWFWCLILEFFRQSDISFFWGFFLFNLICLNHSQVES